MSSSRTYVIGGVVIVLLLFIAVALISRLGPPHGSAEALAKAFLKFQRESQEAGFSQSAIRAQVPSEIRELHPRSMHSEANIVVLSLAPTQILGWNIYHQWLFQRSTTADSEWQLYRADGILGKRLVTTIREE